ncbi:MAG TPA: hypothetical protein DCP03_00645 [Polaromonas sp.]|nr:hypothetical protein [Polaromonas sp.]
MRHRYHDRPGYALHYYRRRDPGRGHWRLIRPCCLSHPLNPYRLSRCPPSRWHRRNPYRLNPCRCPPSHRHHRRFLHGP